MLQDKDPKKEKTLVIIKPGGIQRSLIGEIIKRYERCGLKLVALKMLIPTRNIIKKHYISNPNGIEDKGKQVIETYTKHNKQAPYSDPQKMGEFIFDILVKYMTSGPVIAMIWQGINAIGVVRKITGSTEPRSSDVGTIRGDLTIDSYQISDMDKRAVRNLIHASGNPQEAQTEINLWFKKDEVLSYRLISEEILYDVNLDGILE